MTEIINNIKLSSANIYAPIMFSLTVAPVKPQYFAGAYLANNPKHDAKLFSRQQSRPPYDRHMSFKSNFAPIVQFDDWKAARELLSFCDVTNQPRDAIFRNATVTIEYQLAENEVNEIKKIYMRVVDAQLEM